MVVSKGKLKAKMLEYFREIERTGEPLIVTDHGREVLEIRPLRPAGRVSAEDIREWYREGGGKSLPISEEALMAPLPEEEWEVLREDDRNPWQP